MSLSDLTKTLESLHPAREQTASYVRHPTSPCPHRNSSPASGLDESRLDMASGWLQSKGLLDVKDESVTSFGHRSPKRAGSTWRKGNARDAHHHCASRRETVHGQGRDPDLGHGSYRSQFGRGSAQGIEGGPDRPGRHPRARPAADLSSYEFLADLIKTVSGTGPGRTATSFAQTEQAAIQANFHKRGKSKGIFRITEKKNRSYRLTPAGQELLTLLTAAGRRYRRSLGAHARDAEAGRLEEQEVPRLQHFPQSAPPEHRQKTPL